MKHNLCLILLSSTMMVSCIKETKTVSKETNPYEGGVPDCVYTNTCIGSSTGGDSGSTTGSTTGWTTGSSTGWTSGWTTGPTTGSIDESNWQGIYPNGVPTGVCSSPTGVGYDTEKVVLTSSGRFDFYTPEDPETLNYKNTDDRLKTVQRAKQLFSTDAFVKVRFKALPEPESSGTDQRICHGRVSGSPGPGYTKMKIWGSIIGVRADGTRGSHPLHPSGIELSVNNCTPGLNLSPYKAMYPNGIYLQINQVKVNNGAGTDYSNYGVPHTKCWSIEFEIATDGTKTFE